MLKTKFSFAEKDQQEENSITFTSLPLVSVIGLNRNTLTNQVLQPIPTLKKRQSFMRILTQPASTIEIISETFGVFNNDFVNHCKFYGIPYGSEKQDLSVTPISERSTFCLFNNNSNSSKEIPLKRKRNYNSLSSSTSNNNSLDSSFEPLPRKIIFPIVDNIPQFQDEQMIFNETLAHQLFTQSNKDLGEFPETSLQNCLVLTQQTKIHSIFTKLIERSSQSSKKQSISSQYESNCLGMFKLNRLDSQKLLSFRFSLYRKKGVSPLSQASTSIGDSSSSGISRFGKYHNFNKLFMYNILSMFTAQNLAELGVPDEISRELQTVISRIKTSAKNNYRVAGKYAFDYFSHAHYNILFYKVSQRNINNFKDLQEYIDLYKQCFHVDLEQPISSITISYLNIIKFYAYNVFITCIAHSDLVIDPTSTSIENLKNQYTMKVVRGVQKLSEGVLIKRF